MDEPLVLEEGQTVEEVARIDLHSTRVRAAGRLANFEAELGEMHLALAEQGYDDQADLQLIEATRLAVRTLNQSIEPRRIFKEKK